MNPSLALAIHSETTAASDYDPVLGLVVGVIVILVALALGLLSRETEADAHSVNHEKPWHFAFLVGSYGRYSTSKFTAFLWLVAVVWGSTVILIHVAQVHSGSTDPFSGTNLGDLNAQYLVLIGSPLATIILSKGITDLKVSDGRLQKPLPGTTTGYEFSNVVGRGIFSDDGGKPDLVDIQYLLFNAVLLAYFVITVSQHAVIPALPDTLVGLTGVSAAAYVTRKAIASNEPGIDALIWTGASLEIRGHNLLSPLDPIQWPKNVCIDGFDLVKAAATAAEAGQELIDWSPDGTSISVRIDPAAFALVGKTIVITTGAGTTVTGLLSRS